MKCPVCNKQMKIGTLDTDDSMGTVWMSIMPCDCVCSYGASKAVWQELIRTRKVLDVAVDEITKIKVAAESVGIGFFMTAAISALAKINTALEQKDAK